MSAVLARLSSRVRAWWLAHREEAHRRAHARRVRENEGRRLSLMLSAPKEGGGRWFS